MSDSPNLSNLDFDNMTVAEFEACLPEMFATGDGKVSEDPRFTKFLAANPDCAALVHDLESIAETAKALFAPDLEVEPSDSVWSNISDRLLKGGILGEGEDPLPLADREPA